MQPKKYSEEEAFALAQQWGDEIETLCPYRTVQKGILWWMQQQGTGITAIAAACMNPNAVNPSFGLEIQVVRKEDAAKFHRNLEKLLATDPDAPLAQVFKSIPYRTNVVGNFVAYSR